MFDGYVFTSGSFTPLGDVLGSEGFELRTRIPYYRGVPLSMVHDVVVEVDGEGVPREDIVFSADDGRNWFTLAQMETVYALRWEYADEARIRVRRGSPLAPGEHEVTLRISCRVAYIPFPFTGVMTRTVTVP